MSVNVRIIGNSLEKMFNDDAFSKATEDLANQMMADMDPFVPYSGKHHAHMANTVHLDGNKHTIVYNTPYAKAQFYGFITNYKTGQQSRIYNYTTVPHEQATRRWDLRAKGLYSDKWSRIVGESFKGKHVPPFTPHGPNEGDPDDGPKGKN